MERFVEIDKLGANARESRPTGQSTSKTIALGFRSAETKQAPSADTDDEDSGAVQSYGCAGCAGKAFPKADVARYAWPRRDSVGR